MTLEVRNNIGIPLGSYSPGSGGGGGGGSSGDTYTKDEIDDFFAEIDALLAELEGSKSTYVTMLNELNGEA